MFAASVRLATSSDTSAPGASSTNQWLISLAKFAVPVVAVHVLSGIATPSTASRRPVIRLFPTCTSAVAMTVKSCDSPVSFRSPKLAVELAASPKELAPSSTPEIDIGTYTPVVVIVTVCVVCELIWP
jgi:hypothetical protein